MLDALAAVAQFALYVGILCASGAVFARASLRAEAQAAQTLDAVARYGAIVTIVATFGGALVLVYRLGGAFDEPTLSAVLMSSVGAAGGMRIVGAFLLLATPAQSGDTFSGGMRSSYAALLAASFVFLGHASAAGFAAGLMAAVHVSLAGWWIASLIAMERVCRSNDAVAAAEIVRRFSRIAVAAIVLLIVAGIVMIATLVALPIAKITAYLATLGAKIGIAMLVFGLAAYNKFRLTPHVARGDATAIRSLRAAIDLELILIVAVLIATTLMTTYNAPDE